MNYLYFKKLNVNYLYIKNYSGVRGAVEPVALHVSVSHLVMNFGSVSAHAAGSVLPHRKKRLFQGVPLLNLYRGGEVSGPHNQSPCWRRRCHHQKKTKNRKKNVLHFDVNFRKER